MTAHDPGRPRHVLEFIWQFFEDNGYWPSIREIGEGVGLASTSAVDYHLRRLEQRGFLRRPSHRQSRALVITSEGYDAMEAA